MEENKENKQPAVRQSLEGKVEPVQKADEVLAKKDEDGPKKEKKEGGQKGGCCEIF